VLAANPAAEVRLPKKDAATRLLVADEDLVRLLEAAERQRSDFRSVRDRAVLSVFIFCGLRRQELLALRLSALNLADQSLLVQQGKATSPGLSTSARKSWSRCGSGWQSGNQSGVRTTISSSPRAGAISRRRAW
jgi:site-specific recombinase XerC